MFLAALMLVPAIGAAAQTGGGYLEGAVTDETTGQPVAGFRMALNYYDGTVVGGTVAWTDEQGRYRFGPMPAGTFKLQFLDNELFRFAEEWWRDKPDFATADPVTVLDGLTLTGIDFVVAPPVPEPGGYVEGRLTVVPDGTPVPAGLGFSIQAVALDGSYLGEAFGRSGEDGRYRVGPLPPGDVKLRFVDHTWFAYEGAACPCFTPDGSPALYTAWWPDVADLASAAVVQIRIDQTSVADFSLRQVGQIPQVVTTTTPVVDVLPFTGARHWQLTLSGLAMFLLGVGLVRSGTADSTRP